MQNSLDTALALVFSHKAANITTPTATNGAAVDCKNARYARAFVDIPTLTGNETVAAKVQYSVTGSTNWTDVPSAAFTSAAAASNDNRVAHGLIDMRKVPANHLRIVITTGGTVDVLVSSGFLIGHPLDAEAQRQAMDFRIIPG